MKSISRLLCLIGIIYLPILCVLRADPVIVIDPGHGGPGAWKYGSNGDEAGTVGPSGLTEEWVNLNVALEMRDQMTVE